MWITPPTESWRWCCKCAVNGSTIKTVRFASAPVRSSSGRPAKSRYSRRFENGRLGRRPDYPLSKQPAATELVIVRRLARETSNCCRCSSCTCVSLIITAQTGVPSPPRNVRVLAEGSPEVPPTEPPQPPPQPCAIPAASGGPHAYFDTLVKRSEHLCNWSLRSQAQLDRLTAEKRSIDFTYQPSEDSYPNRQDAAKFLRSPGTTGGASIPTRQQVRMTLPQVENGSIIITWDWYWGKEFRENHGAVTHWKAFSVRIGGTHGWWTLMNNLGPSTNSPNPDEVSKVTDEIGSGVRANGMISTERVTPSGPDTPPQRPTYAEAYPQYHSRWTRFWIELKLLQPPSAFTEWSSTYLKGAPLNGNPGDPQGRWHMASLWSADEGRDVHRLLYRIPLNWKAEIEGRTHHVTRFDLQMNSSKSGLTGPLVGYVRNVVMLHNYRLPANPETDSLLFQRPRR